MSSESLRKHPKNEEKPYAHSQIGKEHYRITWVDALRAHEEALKDGGADGTLDSNAIRSAIAQPYSGYHHTIHKKAAALVHSLVLNHGFVDGNKRTALYLVEVLANQSGYTLVVCNRKGT